MCWALNAVVPWEVPLCADARQRRFPSVVWKASICLCNFNHSKCSLVAICVYQFWRWVIMWWGLCIITAGGSSSVWAWGCLCPCDGTEALLLAVVSGMAVGSSVGIGPGKGPGPQNTPKAVCFYARCWQLSHLAACRSDSSYPLCDMWCSMETEQVISLFLPPLQSFCLELRLLPFPPRASAVVLVPRFSSPAAFHTWMLWLGPMGQVVEDKSDYLFFFLLWFLSFLLHQKHIKKQMCEGVCLSFLLPSQTTYTRQQSIRLLFWGTPALSKIDH